MGDNPLLGVSPEGDIYDLNVTYEQINRRSGIFLFMTAGNAHAPLMSPRNELVNITLDRDYEFISDLEEVKSIVFAYKLKCI